MSNIREVPPPTPAVNENLVESLECHLAAAKSGQLTSMAFAGILSDDTYISEFLKGTGNVFGLIGAIEYCKNRVLTCIEG